MPFGKSKKTAQFNAKYRDFLHDQGYASEQHRFKLFHFSGLRGKYRIVGKQILFDEGFSLEIRTADRRFFELIKACFQVGKTVSLLGQRITVKQVQLPNRRITEDKIRVQMVSAVVARMTDNGHSVYYSPADSQFSAIVNRNFAEKYQAFTGQIPASKLVIDKVSNIKKVVSRYKDLWITGYLCQMELRAKAEYLDFLYNTGLGSKNAQGFGMFALLEKEE